jgi:hypothetical protein
MQEPDTSEKDTEPVEAMLATLGAELAAVDRGHVELILRHDDRLRRLRPARYHRQRHTLESFI